MVRNQHQALGLDQLIQAVTSYIDPIEATAALSAAFEIASEAHKGVQRIDGEPYVSHSLAVAAILAQWHAPLPVLAVGILHDLLSPDYSRGYTLQGPILDEVRSKLGINVSLLLDAVIDLNNFMRHVEGGDYHSEADSKDFRNRMAAFLQQERDAVVIKIADRLHNLQTASVLTHPYQERVSNVGLNLLVPLADRLGMGIARRQMEDYCFEINNPMYHKLLRQQCADSKFNQEIEGVLQELRQVFDARVPGSKIHWQPFSLYTIGQDLKLGKLVHVGSISLRMVDAGAFIIVTGEEMECYHALGTLHKLYPPVKGQLHDLIGNPRENGYRSLHTQVKHSTDNFLRIAIRTRTMDMIDEYGISAHWWNIPEDLLPQLPEVTKPAEGAIQVFTPKGEEKYLPQGATPIDFAYSIHTDIGHQCVDVLVNDERGDLYRPLRTGDRVEIIFGGPSSGPKLDWLNHVQTPQATSHIRHWLALHRRDDMLESGLALLDRELQALGLDSTDARVLQLLTRLAIKENLKNRDDLLVAIGVGRLKASRLVEILKSMRLKSVRSPGYLEPSLSVQVLSSEEARLPQTFARCCGPVAGDDIVGYRRNDGILIIHKRGCPQIKESGKFAQVKWGTTPSEPEYVIIVEALNRPGLASDISTIAALLGIDMPGFSAFRRVDGVMAEVQIYLGKTTPAQRNRVLKALEGANYNVEVIHSSFLSTPAQVPGAFKPIHRSNPYSSGIAEGTRFYGREAECERLAALLHDQALNRTILVWGQRRIGKTSFVLRLKDQAQGGYLPVYIDMQGLKDSSTTQFLYRLMSSLSQALKDHVANLEREITVPALNRLRKGPLAQFDTFMALILEVVRQYPLVVVLDEFQCLSSLREEEVSRSAIFSRLRSHSLHERGIHLILSGGGLLSHLKNQWDMASLFNIAHTERLGFLEQNAAHKLIKDGLSRVGNITEYAIKLLLDYTAGHPFYLQLLCSMLYDQAQENKSIITSQAASQGIREWLGRADASRFQHLWEGQDAASALRNKFTLSAIAQLGANSHEVAYERLVSVVCPTVSEHDLVQILEDLSELGVIVHNHSNYAISVELFARWLRQHWPLEQALKEVRWI